MTPEQQREWESDEAQPSTFPARGAILPACEAARGFSDADLLRKRTEALNRTSAENERLRAVVRDVELLCACESTGCPCGGDRVSVSTRDLRAVLARSQAPQAPAEQEGN